MKYLVFALLLIICLAPVRQPNPCKLVQRYYLNGQLVHTLVRDSLIKDYGCSGVYRDKEKVFVADSVVTSLK